MDTSRILSAYRQASKRLLLLDYDGVLVPIAPTPDQAAPTQQTYDLLRQLAADSRNCCVIISGRPRQTLDNWLGKLPLAFAAEHGLWRRESGDAWVFAVQVSTAWKRRVYQIMEQYTARLPGSFIEEKYAGLAFHYRAVEDPDAKIRQLIGALQEPLSLLGLKLIHGKKVVEVIVDGVDKGTAARFWLDKNDWQFILGVGDDTTDEALFEALPVSAFSIKVGKGQTAARSRLSSQVEFVNFLDNLSKNIA